jgi:hypothetical protein
MKCKNCKFANKEKREEFSVIGDMYGYKDYWYIFCERKKTYRRESMNRICFKLKKTLWRSHK